MKMIAEKKDINSTLEGIVDTYRHQKRKDRNRIYNQFLDDIYSQGRYSSARTILKLYSLGIKFMENGRAGDENLFSALNIISHFINMRDKKLGKIVQEKIDYIYGRNWSLLETL